MKNLLHPQDCGNLVARIQQLQPTNSRRWGSLTIDQMLAHLADPLRLAIGEKAGEKQKSILYGTMFGRIMALYAPWPKGAPTDPNFLPGTGGTPPASFEQDKQTLLELIARFTRYEKPYMPSPVFGDLGRRGWGRLMWRHVDHHLRQFGA